MLRTWVRLVGAALVDHRAAPSCGVVLDDCALIEVDESLVPPPNSVTKVRESWLLKKGIGRSAASRAGRWRSWRRSALSDGTSGSAQRAYRRLSTNIHPKAITPFLSFAPTTFLFLALLLRLFSFPFSFSLLSFSSLYSRLFFFSSCLLLLLDSFPLISFLTLFPLSFFFLLFPSSSPIFFSSLLPPLLPPLLPVPSPFPLLSSPPSLLLLFSSISPLIFFGMFTLGIKQGRPDI